MSLLPAGDSQVSLQSPLRILFVEDVPEDWQLAERGLRREGMQFTSVRVDTREEFLRALEEFRPDIVVSDYSMPAFDGMEALRLAHAFDANLPFVVLTGSMNEEIAVSCIRAGASDYVIKQHSKRLPHAIRAALDRAKGARSEALAREEMQRQRIFAEALMETSPACILVFDADRVIVFANAETDRVLGLSREQVMALSCGSGFNLMDVSGAPLPDGQQPPCRVFVTEVPVYSLEYLFESPTGRRVLSVSAAPLYDESGSVSRVVATIEDVTARKRRELEREQALQRLERAMTAIVTAMSTAVEMRDPYTAGHQMRVTRLACAIATQMGMSEQSIKVLAVAGQVHDLGKLRIPAEILTKPRTLTDIEYGLMQEHPRATYELLKGIEFEGPVADVAYQHHERLNGSGYPQRLTGDQMLAEARVLAVADVFEAMSSHRPYRAALGVAAALEELEKGRGTLYDPAAVDACACLVRERGFSLD